MDPRRIAEIASAIVLAAAILYGLNAARIAIDHELSSSQARNECGKGGIPCGNGGIPTGTSQPP